MDERPVILRPVSLRPITATVTVAALLVAAGCAAGIGNRVSGGNAISGEPGRDSVSSAVSCVNDVCRIEVAGGTPGSRLGVLGRQLSIDSIEDDAAVVTVGDEQRRVAVGATETVGGLAVRVLEAGDERASLEVRRG